MGKLQNTRRVNRIALLGYNEVNGDGFWNGVSRVIYNQTMMLRERGYEVICHNFFTRDEYKNLNRFLIENKIDLAIWHMTTLKIKGRIHTPCPLICLWHNTPVAQLDIDVFCAKYKINAPIARVLKTKAVRWLILKLKNLYTSIVYTYVTSRADKYVLLSEGFKSLFFPAKVFPKKVTAIPNFLSRQLVDVKVDIWEKKKEVLFVGRMDNAQKRIDLLLQVWKKIEEKYNINDWILNICGGGPDAEMLKQMKEELGLQNVYFRGVVSPEEWYRTAPIFCMTSEFEGFGLVLTEAAAFSCVPMAFDSFEAVHDIITDKENGRLIKAFDVDAYAEALAELIENKDYRMKLAENAKRDVKKFGPDVVMDEWEKLFAEVLDKRK